MKSKASHHILLNPSSLLGLVLPLAVGLACTSLPRHPRPADFDGVGGDFSGELVQAHVETLRGLGPRLPGTESDRIARAYLARAFRLSGALVDELDRGEREQLVAEISGASRDVVMLVAAYPVLGSGRWVDDSGLAVLVELARVLGATKQPYRLQFVLAETRPAAAATTDEESSKRWESVATARAASELLIEAGRELAQEIEAEGEFERIRAIIVMDLSGRTDLLFARDLRSHPGFRKIFWESAARLGQVSMFPGAGDWRSPGSLHLGFRERSMDRILALVSGARSGGERGSAPAGSAEVTPQALTSFGHVTVDALQILMQRFKKVDAFSR